MLRDGSSWARSRPCKRTCPACLLSLRATFGVRRNRLCPVDGVSVVLQLLWSSRIEEVGMTYEEGGGSDAETHYYRANHGERIEEDRKLREKQLPQSARPVGCRN